MICAPERRKNDRESTPVGILKANYCNTRERLRERKIEQELQQAVLPTGQKFGRITPKGPRKKIRGRIRAGFSQKGPKEAEV
jgi:hypothetical protein